MQTREKLKTVHTRNDLERVRKEVYKWRDKLLEVSEDFRKEIEEKQRANLPGRPNNFDGRINKIKGRAEEVRRIADLLRRNYDPRLREMKDMMRERLTNVQGRLICPKCGSFDMGNVWVTEKGKRKRKMPWCFKCNVQLMPESKVKEWKKDSIKMRTRFTDEERKAGWGR